MTLAPVNISGKTVFGEHISLEHKEQSSVILNSTLTDCTLEFRQSARALVLGNSRLINCVLCAKRPQRSHQFFTTQFAGCRFSGDFSGCEFGPRLDMPNRNVTPGFENCDFRDANIHLCTFTGNEVSSVLLPTWPYAAVLNPQASCARITDLANSFPAAVSLAKFLARLQSNVSFITLDFSEKTYWPDGNFQASGLREQLIGCDFVYMAS